MRITWLNNQKKRLSVTSISQGKELYELLLNPPEVVAEKLDENNYRPRLTIVDATFWALLKKRIRERRENSYRRTIP
ncbi:MAG: hypothetical protein ACFFAS_11100 [Promethearchaeota archaeon]